MPNIKSAKKRVKIIAAKTLQNKMIKTSLKSTIKKYEKTVTGNDKTVINEMYRKTIKKIDQAVSKGILHKNTAARKKSRMAKTLNSIGA